MRREISFGKRNLRFYYYRYKDSPYYSIGLLSFIILACIIIFFQVIVPQFMNWFSIRKEVVATNEKIAILKKNINFMNNIDKSLLDSQLQTASSALPPDRDFVSILNALSDDAIHAGVSIDDFNFQVGNIDSSKGKVTDPAYKDLSIIRISLVIHGPFDNIKRFVQQVGEKLPLAETVSINGNNGSVSLTIQFYQKPFPKTALSDETPLVDVSDSKKELLQKLSTWKAAPLPVPVSSASQTASDSSLPLF